MKKILSIIVFVFAVFAFAGCGKKDDVLRVTLASKPDTIDPALNSAVDGATYLVHLFEGLVAYKPDGNNDGLPDLAPGVAKAIPEPVALEDGKVSYTFELRDGLKWSDGSALDANDFVYSWNRAVANETASDYQYIFDIIDGYDDVVDDVEDARLNVTASADGKQLTVVLKVDVSYFIELCAFPTFFPVKESVVEADPEAWATKKETYICNGPYVIETFDNSQLVVTKNEYYWDKDSVTMPKISFVFSADDNNILANYLNGTYKFIDSVPNDEIARLQSEYPNEFVVAGQLGTYYINFNVNAFAAFSEAEKVKIRKALSLLIDRNYIVEEIGQAGQVPAASFVPMGMTEPDGSEFVENNGPDGDGAGYYSVAKDAYESNCAAAVQLFKEVAQSSGLFSVGTDNKLVGFPSFEYILNESTGHRAIATYLQGAFANYGITMTIAEQEWNTFLNTRKEGNYTLARNGWLADYNDPITFLDMWTSTSGNNDSQFGKGAHASYNGYSFNGQNNLTWAQSYDQIIAAIKASSDPVERYELMHEAEDLLMSTGAIVPLYFYTDIYMVSPKLEGFFSSPLGYKFFTYSTLK
ncbi:MAG: peptide ABC transporter substrate-binding protein [Acholeplasmataceae bacterium]|nr:peptide ABC transporter substrate-binding protein [Acholeplasmataceae bacterium]